MASELSRPKNRGCSVSESSPDVQSMCLVHMYGISHCKEKNKTNTFLNNRKKISQGEQVVSSCLTANVKGRSQGSQC